MSQSTQPQYTSPTPDPERIARFWVRHARPGEVYEIRIPKPKRNGPRRFFRVMSGYFDDVDALVNELGTITGYDAAGVYCTLNPVMPDLIARAKNRLAETERAWIHLAMIRLMVARLARQ